MHSSSLYSSKNFAVQLDEKGNVVRDEYGNIQYELVEYDIRKKTYNELPEELKKKFDQIKQIHVVLSSENIGFSSGNNLGFSYIRDNFLPEFLVVINND